jgi:two-component system NtrC family response regulator
MDDFSDDIESLLSKIDSMDDIDVSDDKKKKAVQKILICEDSEYASDMIKEFLKDKEFKLEFARNGKTAVYKALSLTGNNISQAAKLLEVSRPTLHDLLKKLEICIQK